MDLPRQHRDHPPHPPECSILTIHRQDHRAQSVHGAPQATPGQECGPGLSICEAWQHARKLHVERDASIAPGACEIHCHDCFRHQMLGPVNLLSRLRVSAHHVCQMHGALNCLGHVRRGCGSASATATRRAGRRRSTLTRKRSCRSSPIPCAQRWGAVT